MGKALLTAALTLIAGVACGAVGKDLLNGFSELGPIAAAAVMGGMTVYFSTQKK